MPNVFAIVGSRDFPDLGFVRNKLKDYNIGEIVTGGAKGVDKAAEKYAYKNGIIVDIKEPDWDEFGKSAGPIRNSKIVNKAEYLIAFWNGSSKGTKDSINKAISDEIPVDIFVRKT